MNRFRKAISVGMSAALLASLFTVIAASTAFAGTTVASAGSVPRAGTSAGPATFTFTENSATALNGTTPGSFTVTILDSGALAKVHFTGTGAISAPGSLGASLTVGDNFFTVDLAGNDPLNVETIVVSGLSITADAGAALGAIDATFSGDAPVYNAFVGATVTATGTLGTTYVAGATSILVNVTSDCGFGVSGTPVVNGNLIFNNENKAISAVTGTTVQTLTIAATANGHAIGEAVTQTVANCSPTAVASPGTVVDSGIYNSSTIGNIFPGENNQSVPSLSITERTAGYFSVGTTITFTIATAGVTFSNAPSASGLAVSGGALSVDRKSVSWTVTTASGVPATFVVNMNYDVAASVPSGTQVSVTAALSGGKILVPTSRVNAVVGRIFNAAAATVPNVFIGQNAQKTGLISLTEVAAGSFTDGTGSFNTFMVCVDEAGNDTFTSPGPWAKVTTTGVGALRLREGVTSSPDNIVQGTPISFEGNACYYWTVWTASTVVSTIQIGNADFTSGALINVQPDDIPGAVVAGLYVGSVSAFSFTHQVDLVIATRVFQNSVIVTALSQPFIPAGATDARPGDIQIAETANGQLKSGEVICVEVLPRASNNAIQDTFLRSLNTSDTPLVTATGGLIIGAVSLSNEDCNTSRLRPPREHTISFSFTVIQQSTSGQGKLVIGNMHFVTVADAPLGAVLVNVYGFGGSPSFVEFQATVSNAKIGTAAIGTGTATTRLGVTQVGAFTTATKIAKVGKYVTYRFDFGVAAAGQLVKVWGATKSGNDWSAFTAVTSRVANASGVVYYSVRQSAPSWKSYRASWAGGNAWTPARQARWIS